MNADFFLGIFETRKDYSDSTQVNVRTLWPNEYEREKWCSK